MKEFIAIIFILLATSAHGQKNKNQPEIVRDAFGQFSFRELSIELTQDGL
jgi:hypothetical protein